MRWPGNLYVSHNVPNSRLQHCVYACWSAPQQCSGQGCPGRLKLRKARNDTITKIFDRPHVWGSSLAGPCTALSLATLSAQDLMTHSMTHKVQVRRFSWLKLVTDERNLLRIIVGRSRRRIQSHLLFFRYVFPLILDKDFHPKATRTCWTSRDARVWSASSMIESHSPSGFIAWTSPF